MAQYEEELAAAIQAVRAAAQICRAVQARLVTAETLEKKDKSPVTVADFASQAVVCQQLQDAFPDDAVVGEEDSAALREGTQSVLRDAVVREVTGSVPGTPGADDVLRWIDRGGADASGGRYWTLDPIDGTKGFLRGQQYAVALGLIEAGEVVLGVLGCPNLPDSEGRPGALFTAVRARGAAILPLTGEDLQGTPVHVSTLGSPGEARFCESVESAHSNQGEAAEIAARLGIEREPYRIDSQCKYAAVARGDASIYLRMPTRKDYREKIWDHSAGKLVVEEAGGRVTDAFGAELDFRTGRTLEKNRGIVATCGTIHDAVIDAVRQVRGA